MRSFTDSMQMERLLSVLNGEAKRTVSSVGRNSIFYAAALKTLKRNFGNPQLVTFLKSKLVLDLPQISTDNHTGKIVKYLALISV